MSKDRYILIIVALLCICYVFQNITINNMRKTIEKQIEVSEKQAAVSQMMIESMQSLVKLKVVQP